MAIIFSYKILFDEFFLRKVLESPTYLTANITISSLATFKFAWNEWETYFLGKKFQKETELNSLYTFYNVLLIKRDVEVEWANLNQVVMIA